MTLMELRHLLHRTPQLADHEGATAETIRTYLESSHPDETVTGLGGAGLAVIFAGAEPGPRVLVRCELDALSLIHI